MIILHNICQIWENVPLIWVNYSKELNPQTNQLLRLQLLCWDPQRNPDSDSWKIRSPVITSWKGGREWACVGHFILANHVLPGAIVSGPDFISRPNHPHRSQFLPVLALPWLFFLSRSSPRIKGATVADMNYDYPIESPKLRITITVLVFAARVSFPAGNELDWSTHRTCQPGSKILTRP